MSSLVERAETADLAFSNIPIMFVGSKLPVLVTQYSHQRFIPYLKRNSNHTTKARGRYTKRMYQCWILLWYGESDLWLRVI